MTIYINGKYLTQRLTGVQRYAFEITKALVSLEVDVKVIIPSFLETTEIDLPGHVLLPLDGCKSIILWEQLTIARFLKNKNDYILLNLCNIGTLFNKNQVLCIHDMTYRVDPKWFSWAFSKYYQFMIPKLVRIAREIVTVSEFSKKEIADHLDVSKDRITVIYNAPSNDFVYSSVENIVCNKEDFFLFVGSMHPRKNINLLIKLFSLEEFRNQRLVVVGAKSKEFAEVDFDLPTNVEVFDKCNDSQLASLYLRAKALLNPSIYEGFGIPIVEAMASGCPLIISDIQVFKEIAADGAIYFNPNSLMSLKNAFNTFLSKSQEEVTLIIQSNFTRSKEFTWERSAKKLLDLINKSQWVG